MEKINMANWWVFDIEVRMSRRITANFYQRSEEFLCVVFQNVITDEVKVWTKDDDMKEMFKFLFSADMLIAHNGREYDIRALGHLFPSLDKPLRDMPLFDTRYASLKHPEKSPKGIYTYKEMEAYDKKLGYPETKQLNALKAWGYRFGFNKLDYYEDYTDKDWENLQLSDQLVEYCKVDVELNVKLFWHLMKKGDIVHA